MSRKKGSGGMLYFIVFVIITMVAYVLMFFASSIFSAPIAEGGTTTLFADKPVLKWIFVIAILAIGGSLFYLAFMFRDRGT